VAAHKFFLELGRTKRLFTVGVGLKINASGGKRKKKKEAYANGEIRTG
jgi:hypothetical protein